MTLSCTIPNSSSRDLLSAIFNGDSSLNLNATIQRLITILPNTKVLNSAISFLSENKVFYEDNSSTNTSTSVIVSFPDVDIECTFPSRIMVGSKANDGDNTYDNTTKDIDSLHITDNVKTSVPPPMCSCFDFYQNVIQKRSLTSSFYVSNRISNRTLGNMTINR